MANKKTLLTTGLKNFLIQQIYFSPVSTVQGDRISSIYCFLSKVEPWDIQTGVPDIYQDQYSLKQIMKNIFVVKNIKTSDISPVVRRVDWQQNNIYDYYKDNENLFEKDSLGYPLYNFYVKNKYDQVFKCLWNNNGSVSTQEPYFQPGQYNTNNIFVGSDGYKWKFLYTLDLAAKFNFMDADWLPVPVKYNAINPENSSAGFGSIDTINILNGGSGYDASNSVISVTITGDGTGAAGTVVVENGSISDIIVSSTGSNYTYASATISSSTGHGAILESPVSPIAGHGSDPLSELGCSHIMISSSFNGAEQDSSGTVMIPTDIDFHQLGLIINPTALSSNPSFATKNIYKTSTDLVLAGGFGVYVNDDLVYQGSSIETATFKGRVLSFDQATNILKVINTTGTLITNASIWNASESGTPKTVRTLLTYSKPDFISLSGNIAYIENRDGIQRSSDGIEQLKIVLGY